MDVLCSGGYVAPMELGWWGGYLLLLCSPDGAMTGFWCF